MVISRNLQNAPLRPPSFHGTPRIVPSNQHKFDGWISHSFTALLLYERRYAKSKYPMCYTVNAIFVFATWTALTCMGRCNDWTAPPPPFFSISSKSAFCDSHSSSVVGPQSALFFQTEHPPLGTGSYCAKKITDTCIVFFLHISNCNIWEHLDV